MSNKQNITIIGTDSSHIVAFAKLFQQNQKEWDWEISAVIRHNDSKMPISVNRRAQIEEQIKQLHIPIVDGYSTEILEKTDAFIIGNVDANYHKDILKEILFVHKPVFIDKPIAYSPEETAEIFEIAKKNNVPLFSSSSLRFSESFVTALKNMEQRKEMIQNVKVRGPLTFLPEVKGLYWYGIHLIEMIEYMEQDSCSFIKYEEDSEQLNLYYQGKHTAYTLIGDKSGEASFSGELSTGNATYYFDTANDSKPLYAYLIEEMIRFFETTLPPFSYQHTKNVIQMIEEANQVIWKD